MSSFFNLIYTQLFVSLPKPTQAYDGKTVIVTGSNVGLGKEAARHFVKQGAESVILAVRSLEKGEAAKEDIDKSTGVGPDVVKVWQLDMSSYQSVLDFAKKVDKELSRLDIALLNAGVAKGKFEIVEKDETDITVNDVSTMLLAFSLLPLLKKTATKFNTRPNLTIVSSSVHYGAKFPEKDAPEGEIFTRLATDDGKVDMPNRYSVSKLINVLNTRAMADRKSASQIPVTINTVNPGLCHSELSRDSFFFLEVVKFFLARSTEVGSRTLVHAASQGPETHGQYLSDCTITAPSQFVLSKEGYEAQNRVWDEMVKKLEAIKKGVTSSL